MRHGIFLVRPWLWAALAFCLGAASVTVLTRLIEPESPLNGPVVVPAPLPFESVDGSAVPGRAQFDHWEKRRHVDVSQYDAWPCPGPGVPVRTIVVLGQSNAANSVGARHKAQPGSFNWLDGRCYAAAGPTLGSDGTMGSVWPIVGDMLRQARPDLQVVFVGMAFGGTSIREWADNRSLGGFMKTQLLAIQQAGLHVTDVVWHQGETDAAMSAEDYRGRLTSIVRAINTQLPQARIYVAQASLCYGGRPSRPDLLGVQADIRHAAVRPGPNTDRIDRYADRYDGCHFSGEGARRLAEAWAVALQQ